MSYPKKPQNPTKQKEGKKASRKKNPASVPIIPSGWKPLCLSQATVKDLTGQMFT